MNLSQAGIFALGTASHAYLEFDAHDAEEASELVPAIARLREPRTTMGGVNLVAGFRPELWQTAAPDAAPRVEGFDHDLVGTDGYTIPATQHDALLWLSGSAYDVVFDAARAAIGELAPLATVAEETSSWPYHQDLDLTGFIDGTQTHACSTPPEVALDPRGEPRGRWDIVLLQKWVHDAAAWESLPVEEQEQVMGRTKSDSVELEEKRDDSHVASTDQEEFGQIFRRNMPFGTVTDHGTMFVGFSADQGRLASMLERMAGIATGTRDALTAFTHPVTGAYYVVPSSDALRRWVPVDERLGDQ